MSSLSRSSSPTESLNSLMTEAEKRPAKPKCPVLYIDTPVFLYSDHIPLSEEWIIERIKAGITSYEAKGLELLWEDTNNL